MALLIGVSKGTTSNLEREIVKTTPEALTRRALSGALGLPELGMLYIVGAT